MSAPTEMTRAASRVIYCARKLSLLNSLLVDEFRLWRETNKQKYTPGVMETISSAKSLLKISHLLLKALSVLPLIREEAQ